MKPEATRLAPTEFETAVNCNTAKAVRLTVPSTLVAIAEEVIKNQWLM